jgi:hypothetical protein
VDERPEEVELSLLCAVAPGVASANIGEKARSTLRARANQQVPVDTPFLGVNLGEKKTFIPQLYDGLGIRMQARTTTVNGDIQAGH